MKRLIIALLICFTARGMDLQLSRSSSASQIVGARPQEKRSATAAPQVSPRPMPRVIGSQPGPYMPVPEARANGLSQPGSFIAGRVSAQGKPRAISPQMIRAGLDLTPLGSQAPKAKDPSPPSRITLSWLSPNGEESVQDVPIRRELYAHLQLLQFIGNDHQEKLAFTKRSFESMGQLCESLKGDPLVQHLWKTDVMHAIWAHKIGQDALEDIKKSLKEGVTIYTSTGTFKFRMQKEIADFFPCFQKAQKEGNTKMDLERFEDPQGMKDQTFSVLRELLYLIYNHSRLGTAYRPSSWNEQDDGTDELIYAIKRLLQAYNNISFFKPATLIALANMWNIHPIAYGAILYALEEKKDQIGLLADRINPSEFELLTRRKEVAICLCGLLPHLLKKYPGNGLLRSALSSCVTALLQTGLFKNPAFITLAEECPAIRDEMLAQIRNNVSVQNLKVMNAGRQKASFSSAFFLKTRYLVGVLGNCVVVIDTQVTDRNQKKLIFSAQYKELVAITPLDAESFAVAEKNSVYCVEFKDGSCSIASSFDYGTDTIGSFCALDGERLILVGTKRTVIVNRKGALIHTWQNAIQKKALQEEESKLAFRYDEEASDKQKSIITASGHFIDAYSEGNPLQIWSATEPFDPVGHRLSVDATNQYEPVKALFRLDDKRIILSHANGLVTLWSCETGKLIAKLAPENDNDTALCFAPLTEKQVAIGYKSGLVRNWDMSKSDQIIAFKMQKAVIDLSYVQGTLSIIFEDGEVRDLFMNEYATLRDWITKL